MQLYSKQVKQVSGTENTKSRLMLEGILMGILMSLWIGYADRTCWLPISD